MNPDAAHDVEAVDDRRLLVRFIVLFFGLLVLVALVIGVGINLQQGPNDYFARPANAEQRMALIARAEAELREAQAAITRADTPDHRLAHDVALIAIAIQRHAIANDGQLPRRLSEAGIGPDDVEPGLRYSYGGRYWRLFQGGNRLLARGN